MPRRLLTILALFLALSAWAETPDGGAADAAARIAAEFEGFFVAAVAEEDLPGAAFAIVTADRIVRVAGTGRTALRGGRNVDPNTVFRLASVSKTFAGGLAARLVADGRLSWDDPVVRWVPEFRIKGDASRITVAHVLGQSVGLMPHAYDNLVEDGVEPERILERLADLEPLCAPGECYGYQNTVFNLVEPVVDRAAGASYPELVEQRIFRPLDMQTASLGYDAFMATANRAEPHVRRRGGWAQVKVKPNYYRVPAAAGVNASALDLAKWLRAQLGSHPEVFSPEMVRDLTTPGVETRRERHRREWRDLVTDAHYGLGWRVYDLGGEPLAYHGGWVQGYRADLAYAPRLGIGIAVLVNVETRLINTLTARFWKMALAEMPRAPALPTTAVAAGAGDD